MKENLLIDKSIAFTARIVKLHQHLIKNKRETLISKQIPVLARGRVFCVCIIHFSSFNIHHSLKSPPHKIADFPMLY